MTAAEAIRAAEARLAGQCDTARLDAELLMAHLLGKSRSELLLRHLTDPAPPGYDRLVTRRLAHEPVAYITGRQAFYGHEFIVTPDVLIPRGDSEVLVELALQACVVALEVGGGRVLDCGTGSGALLLSVLAGRPLIHGVGIDRSLGAIAVAAANAAQLGVADRAALVHKDWNEAGWADDLGRFALILANPPYVEADAMLSATVRDHEPAGALFAGPEGLDDYRVLIPQLPALLTDGGTALVEIGANQADAVSAIAVAAGFTVTLHRDLAKRPRVLMLQN